MLIELTDQLTTQLNEFSSMAIQFCEFTIMPCSKNINNE